MRLLILLCCVATRHCKPPRSLPGPRTRKYRSWEGFDQRGDDVVSLCRNRKRKGKSNNQSDQYRSDRSHRPHRSSDNRPNRPARPGKRSRFARSANDGDTVFIQPKRRRQGIGNALLSFAVAGVALRIGFFRLSVNCFLRSVSSRC
jgi:hypothetical protein